MGTPFPLTVTTREISYRIKENLKGVGNESRDLPWVFLMNQKDDSDVMKFDNIETFKRKFLKSTIYYIVYRTISNKL